ncbi:MAG: multiheme c-type cytochrome [Pyrinomonadaceae bacterium]
MARSNFNPIVLNGMRIAALVLFGLVVFLLFLWSEGKSLAFSNRDYSERVSESYDYRFGRDRPFAPGNANTFNGEFIEGKDFVASARCASCHRDVHPQWADSAHARSFIEPFYQKNVQDLQREKNIAFTRHCESCHNPAALFSGALTDNPLVKERPFDKDGVSCIVCHSIEAVTGKGIGGYVMGQPAMIVDKAGNKLLNVTDQDITNDVEGHKRAVMRDLLKKPEFCGACHKSQVPKELNDYKFMRAFMVADEYQRSSFAKETPHPFYTREKETCNSCHMKRVPTEKFDVSVKNDTIVSHRFAAANTAIPMVFNSKRQFDEVVSFLQDDKVAVDIFAITRREGGNGKPKLYAPLNRKSFKVKGGDDIVVDVVVSNKNIGHSFPPELRDFYEAFVEFSVSDADGKILFKSGVIKPNGKLEDAAHSYKTHLVFADGKLNDLHHIWRTKVVGYNNLIQSGRSDVARYGFSIPEGYEGDLKLSASVRYRRFTRVFSDYVFGRDVNLPIVDMAKASETIVVGEKTKPAGDVDEKNDWRRWNNYGIALLDNKQFPQAADAFDEVIDFKNDYRTVAYTNKALALMEIGAWREASQLVSKSLKAEPDNLRSLFQQARIDKTFGRLDEAEEKFKKVLETYPDDRNSLQQLGELSKVRAETADEESREAKLQRAADYFEQILRIDPEDLSAIYNMMLITRKLGDRDGAYKYSELFKDQKDDTQVAYIAADFLEENSEIGNESRPFHLHRLAPYSPESEFSQYPLIEDLLWTGPMTTSADFESNGK